MKSAASYFSVSSPLIKENIRRYWAIPAISFLVYFLSGVFPLLISYHEIDQQYYFIESLLINHNPFFMMAHLIVPVITAVVVFRYLQTTASVTTMHAMPFSRAKLFNSNVLSGLILTTIPVFVTGFILLLISKPVYNPRAMAVYTSAENSFGSSVAGAFAEPVNVFARMNILNWMWESLIIILVIYAVAVFAGLVTGNSLMHIAAGFGFNFLIPALFGIFTLYCQQYLYGFSAGNDWGEIMLGLSPYLQVFESGGELPWILQILYILNALVLFAVSMYLYNKRKLEKASDAFVFSFMIPVMSYLIAFFGMTFLGFYFEAIGTGDVYLYAGLLSGAIIFFLIGRMIVVKTFRVFDKQTAQSFGVYLVIAALFVSSFTFDLTGFEKRVPDADRINNVNLSAYVGYGLFPPRGRVNNNDVRITTAENIAAFRAFHKSVIENRAQIEDDLNFRYTVWTFLHYDLNGLFNMSRQYTLNYGFIRDSRALAQIFESEEYKSHFLFSEADLTGLTSIHINSVSFSDRQALITGINHMRELLACVDLDFKAQTYQSAVSFRNPYAEFLLIYDDPHNHSRRRTANIIIPRDYKNTIEWLKNNGTADQIEVTAEMIDSVIVSKEDDPWRGDWRGSAWDAPPPSMNMRDPVEITDKEQISIILETFETTRYVAESYRVEIKLNSEFFDSVPRDLYFSYYSGETLPSFLRGSF